MLYPMFYLLEGDYRAKGLGGRFREILGSGAGRSSVKWAVHNTRLARGSCIGL